jgi:hypothetical protein
MTDWRERCELIRLRWCCENLQEAIKDYADTVREDIRERLIERSKSYSWTNH